MGVEPGLSDVFARYAADHLFSEIDEIGVRDGADLVIDGYDFAPTFSVWTTIEECLNPPLVWERDRGFFTTAPFSEPETFVFPEGIGADRVRERRARRGAADPARGRLPACHVQVRARRRVHRGAAGAGEDRASRRPTPVTVRGVEVSPRDVVAAVLPDPATLGDRMHGRTCAGTWVTGTGVDGKPARCTCTTSPTTRRRWRRHGAQAVVWQTAINPVVALELLAAGVWQGAGVLGPEAFDAVPFLDRLRARGEEWHIDER